MVAVSVRSRIAGCVALLVVLSAAIRAQVASNADLVAHEWGTFTSIAGKDGRAVRWSPLDGSVDLPSFVEHFSGAAYKVGLRGTVRMETPVLYFYSPQETQLAIKVSFSKGLITEWYPRASQIEPSSKNAFDRNILYHQHRNGTISWNSVTVSPNIYGKFPRDVNAEKETANQYYAARETAAAPLVVKTTAGDQQEKFLFYRGVSTFSPPISATVTSEGGVRVANLGEEEIPSVILFERRGEKLGYRLAAALPGEMFLESPELTATVESLSRDLEDVLTSQGLYPDEARAMIATWRKSWFEEGSRLFYIVPNHFLNAILPLTINPAPSQIVRVFVGRLELITPATMRDVQKILTAHDLHGLEKYNRFLAPIINEMRAQNPAEVRQMEKDLDLTYNSPAP